MSNIIFAFREVSWRCDLCTKGLRPSLWLAMLRARVSALISPQDVLRLHKLNFPGPNLPAFLEKRLRAFLTVDLTFREPKFPQNHTSQRTKPRATPRQKPPLWFHRCLPIALRGNGAEIPKKNPVGDPLLSQAAPPPLSHLPWDFLEVKSCLMKHGANPLVEPRSSFLEAPPAR